MKKKSFSKKNKKSKDEIKIDVTKEVGTINGFTIIEKFEDKKEKEDAKKYKEIYMTDPDGNNRIDLLSLDKNQEYLNNTVESYVLPEYTCGLNQLTPEMEKFLPKNDSRFRMDMRLLEEKEETEEAQNRKK